MEIKPFRHSRHQEVPRDDAIDGMTDALDPASYEIEDGRVVDDRNDKLDDGVVVEEELFEFARMVHRDYRR